MDSEPVSQWKAFPGTHAEFAVVIGTLPVTRARHARAQVGGFHLLKGLQNEDQFRAGAAKQLN